MGEFMPSSDNAYAESRILRRVVGYYDILRADGWPDTDARHLAIATLAHFARLDYIVAAERLADALARRAADKLKGE
jgi:hypothetical protein